MAADEEQKPEVKILRQGLASELEKPQSQLVVGIMLGTTLRLGGVPFQVSGADIAAKTVTLRLAVPGALQVGVPPTTEPKD